MTSLNGMPATKKPGRSMTLTIVPLPGASTVVCDRSHFAFSSCARVVSQLRLRRLDLRLGRRDLRLHLGDRRELALDAAGELLAHLLLGRARRRQLRGELVDVGLRLLEIEAIAGAGGDELGVLLDARARQLQRRGQRTDLPGRLIQLLVQLPLARACVGEPRLHLRQPLLIGADARLIRRQLGLERMHFVLIRRRIDAEEDVALLHGPVVFDRDFDHASPDLRHDRHDVLHDADIARRRREDIEEEQQDRDRHDREDRHGNLPRRRPRQELQLDEDQPDEEGVDAEQQDFH